MNIRSHILIAATLAAGFVGFQSNGAAAMPRVFIDGAVSTADDGVRVETVRWCNRYGCHRGRYGYYGYGYGYRNYSYYRPYGYGLVLPGVRIGY